MVSISQRMRKLQTKLLAIRTGPGALVLPKEVKRIHLRFAPAPILKGHLGPRKFWRQELVRLKYHNPSVPMTVDQTAEAEDPAVMSVHTQETSSDDTSAPATEAEKIERINMKNYLSSEILDALVRLTNATPVEPTAEDLEEAQKLKELDIKSARDSKLSQEVRARVKRERELLQQARGDLDTQQA